MPNHVHLILAPSDATGLRRAVGEAHRRTTSFINARGRWTGHLFQSRFSSVAMEESYLIAAVRHVSLKPVRARLARKAEDSAWSSVRAHLTRQDDEWISVTPVRNRVDRFAALFESDSHDAAFRAPRSSEASGRPLGNAGFIADLERSLGLSPDARPGESRSAQGAEQLDLPK
jgi:putative transposase